MIKALFLLIAIGVSLYSVAQHTDVIATKNPISERQLRYELNLSKKKLLKREAVRINSNYAGSEIESRKSMYSYQLNLSKKEQFKREMVGINTGMPSVNATIQSTNPRLGCALNFSKKELLKREITMIYSYANYLKY